MALPLQVVLAPFELDDPYLVMFPVSGHFCRHLGALKIGLANLNRIAVGQHEHVREIKGRALVDVELLDGQEIALGDTVLLTASFDDCVHDNVEMPREIE